MSEKEFLKDLALQEPKKTFINMIIIPAMRQIGYYLANESTAAIRTMRNSILNQLDEQDRLELADVVKELEGYEKNLPHNRLELEHTYQKITAHLHVHYLREFGIRAMNPNPRPIRNEEPQQATEEKEQPQNIQLKHIGAN
jgi:hypothetical protein